MPFRIVFAGTSAFATPILEALIHSSHQVLRVYTAPDRRAGRGQKIGENAVKVLAERYEIPIAQPFSWQKPNMQEELHSLNADFMIVVAYGFLLPHAILKTPHQGCLNVHASLLPRWRGAAPIQRAILAGDSETGVSIIQMNKGLDTGDVLAEQSCAIDQRDTSYSLHERLSQMGASLLKTVLENIEKGLLTPKKQDHQYSTYAQKIQKKDAELEWCQPAIVLDRYVRAFNPAPVAFTYFNHHPIRIWEAEARDEKSELNPGTLIQSTKVGLDVATGSGVLRLTRLQYPGKRAHSANDFINAYRHLLVPGKTIFGIR